MFAFGLVCKVPFIIYELGRNGRSLFTWNFVRKPPVLSRNTPVPAFKNTIFMIDLLRRRSWGISTPKYYLVIGITERMYD